MNATEIPMPCHQTPSDAAVLGRRALLLLAASAWSSVPCRATGQTADAPATASVTSGRESNVARLLQAGGCAVLLRHAATEPGVGDPPEFKLDDCRTQRNLSVAGREDAQRIGALFASRTLKPRAVLCSAWCRCKDTADLAFGQHTVWPALSSVFNDRAQLPDQSETVRKALAAVPRQQFEVWVTHQVNITALTGQGIGMGEIFILDGQGTLLARTRLMS